MDLRQLRQFVAVAETLSFHRAAERLNMAQPPLSVSIQKLEAEIGVRLFERSRREVHLTTAGQVMLDRARQTLFEAQETIRSAKAAAEGLEGTLSIGFVGSATCAFLPTVIPAFRTAFPRVQLVLSESTTRGILSQIERKEFDIGIVRAPIARAGRVRLDTVEDDEFVAALPPGHPLAQAGTIDLRDLRDEPFIIYSPETTPGLHALLILLCQEAGFIPAVAQQATQVQTVISLVESGLGVALVPSVSTRHAPQRVTFRRLKQGPANRLSLSLAYQPSWETALGRHFRDVAQAFRRTISL